MATKKPAKKLAKKTSTDYPTKEEIGKTKTDALRRKPVKGWKRDNVKTSSKTPMSLDKLITGKSYKYKGAGSEHKNQGYFSRYLGYGPVTDKYGNEASATPAMMGYLRKNASPYVKKSDKKKKSK